MFSGASSIYRVTMSSRVGGSENHIPTSYPAIGIELHNRHADLSFTRIINYKYSRLTPTIQVGEKVFYEPNVIFADSNFFKIFDFDFLSGDALTALRNPTSVVMTRSMATKYFGDENALGKTITFNGTTEMVVAGVLHDIPSQTHLQFDFVVPMSGLQYSGAFRSNNILESWSIDWFWTYFRIEQPNRVSAIEADINLLAGERIPNAQKEYELKFFLQPLRDIHLRSDFDYNTDITQNGDATTLSMFIGIGILIMLVSSINFINISTATANRRFKEIGVNKILGALRSQLRIQFLAEAIVVSLLALALAFVLLQFTLPYFSLLMGVELSLGIANDWMLIVMAIVLAIIIGALSGLYPAMFMSSLEPKLVLKGGWKSPKGGATFRGTLVGVQVAISIFLIIGTIVIYDQLQFIHNKSLGYDKDQIVMLPVRGTSVSRKYAAFKNKLLSQSSIAAVSSVSEPIGREVQFMTFNIEGHDEPQFVKILNVTFDFAKTMGLEVIEGRDFSRDHPTDSISGFVINETAAKVFGWDNPIGKSLDHSFRNPQIGKVIGVVKDFNFEPLQKQIDPIIIWFGGPYWYVSVRLQPGQTTAALDAMEAAWKEVESDKPFTFQFLDQSIQHVYEKEQRLSQVFFAISVLSIVTAMIGLYGLVSFVMDQRLREIGVRKVLGASVSSIAGLLTKRYALLVLLAFAVSSPFAYLGLNQWLENFAFRVPWSPVYFGVAFVLIVLLMGITILSKVIYAARTNPVEVLRGE